MLSVVLASIVFTPAVAELAVADDALSLLQNFLGSKLSRGPPALYDAAGGKDGELARANAENGVGMAGSRAVYANSSTLTRTNSIYMDRGGFFSAEFSTALHDPKYVDALQ